MRYQEWAGTYWADRVIAVSHSLKGEVQWQYGVPDWKVAAIYNGINAHNFDGWIDPGEVRRRYGVGPTDPMVLYSGRMVYQKGPDLLVETIPGILRFYPQAKFVFAGDGNMRGSVERRAHELSVAHATRFLGYQANGTLADLYKACDVVCVPSRNEPFGIVLLEAWSAGKPVVCTMNGGPGEFVWHEVNGLKTYAQANPSHGAWARFSRISNGPAGWDATGGLRLKRLSIGMRSPTRLWESITHESSAPRQAGPRGFSAAATARG